VAAEGPEAFYSGRVAEAVDADMRAHGGYLRARDLADIPWPVERGVVETTYRGARVISTPPPMGGRLLLFVLRILDRLRPEVVKLPRWPTLRLLAVVFRTALRHRNTPPFTPDDYDPSLDPLLGDPDLLETCLDALLEEVGGLEEEGAGDAHGHRVVGLNHGTSRLRGSAIDPAQSPGETTHLSVMDAAGNAVGITQSVNMVYGSKAAAEGLGFLYNNYLLDTNTTDPHHPHYLKAGNKPWSSACPTLVFWEDRPWLLTGSPGSDRIISTVAQFLIHVMDGGCGLDVAVERPRLHCTAEGIVNLEARRFPTGTAEAFREAGYAVVVQEDYAFYHGAIHAVLRECDSGEFQGVAEIRRDGEPAGPGSAPQRVPD